MTRLFTEVRRIIGTKIFYTKTYQTNYKGKVEILNYKIMSGIGKIYFRSPAGLVSLHERPNLLVQNKSSQHYEYKTIRIGTSTATVSLIYII